LTRLSLSLSMQPQGQSAIKSPLGRRGTIRVVPNKVECTQMAVAHYGYSTSTTRRYRFRSVVISCLDRLRGRVGTWASTGTGTRQTRQTRVLDGSKVVFNVYPILGFSVRLRSSSMPACPNRYCHGYMIRALLGCYLCSLIYVRFSEAEWHNLQCVDILIVTLLFHGLLFLMYLRVTNTERALTKLASF